MPARFTIISTVLALLTQTLVLGKLEIAGLVHAQPTCPEVKAASYDDPGNEDFTIGVGFQQAAAQSFVPNETITLTRVSLYLTNFMGAADNPVTVSVRADASASPGTVLASATANPTNTSPQFVDFVLSPTVTLNAGTTHYIAAVSTGETANRWGWSADISESQYGAGHAFQGPAAGTTWVPRTGWDALFQVWGCAASAPLS